VPDNCLDAVAGFEPSYMTIPLSHDAAGRIQLAALPRLVEAAQAATCVACGPGLSRSPELTLLVGRLYAELAQAAVFDADALNALAADVPTGPAAAGPRILTPHPGEFRRLVGQTSRQEDDELRRTSIRWAAQRQVVLVLKGHRTLVTDGLRVSYNQTGNPGMATGGSGDVLTGVISALVCQGLAPFEAAQLGVHVHGLAGDLAAQQLGQVSLIASDLVRFLPQAFLAAQTH
jgi:NAD(P)H-hydrate epimerase